MKIVLPGGTGQLGQVLVRGLAARGHELVVLTRGAPDGPGQLRWDARGSGPWVRVLDGTDAVINLAGRSVDCRYTESNLRAMMDSRVESTRAVGAAIAQAARPPRTWLQMSTATIYAHRFDAANDEANGVIGGAEPDAPAYWSFSVDIAKNWEGAQQQAPTPATRKVALRAALVLSPDRGGVFATLLGMTRLGLGGAIAGGRQFVSWIHERDFVRAIEFLLERDDLHGPLNLAAPEPLPQREFMAALRRACGVPIGLPATRWMAEIGAFVRRTDTELLLKSRRVVPGRLLQAGFAFEFARWEDAARELVARWRDPSAGRGP